jgi:hypothetical protein
MLLKMLEIEASPTAKVPPGLVFRWTAHHVKEIFLALLPPKFTLDGSEKVQLTCGPRDGEPQYWQVLGTTNFYVEEFDFGHYAQASTEERQEIILSLIEKSLTEIANLSNSNPAPIAETAEAVRKLQFRLSVESKRLKLSLPDKTKRISFFRNLSPENGECWSVRVSDSKGGVLGERTLGKCPHYLDMRDAFKSATLEGTTCVVKNRFDKVLATADLSGLI